MKLTRSLIPIAIGAAVLAVPAAALASSAPSTTRIAPRATSNFQVPLKSNSAFPKATGSAQYQSQPGQSEFQVEVMHLRTLAGKQVRVRANGKTVGWAKVSTRGIAELSRNTELGQSVPGIAAGSTVSVTTSSGVLIASGVF